MLQPKATTPKVNESCTIGNNYFIFVHSTSNTLWFWVFPIWAASWQNQQNGMCAQRRLRSGWASAQSDHSLLCAWCVAKDPTFLQADNEDSDQTADAQADLSLCWAHMPFCWFCHHVAQLYSKGKSAQNLVFHGWKSERAKQRCSAACSSLNVILLRPVCIVVQAWLALVSNANTPDWWTDGCKDEQTLRAPAPARGIT